MKQNMLCHFCRWGTAMLVLTLMGCAQQIIRTEATDQLRAGQYEAAVQGLEQGLVRYPESATLRAGLVTARSEAVSRLIAQSSQERLENRFDDADKTLQRAAALDPQNTRLPVVKADLKAEQRALKSLDDARALVAAGKKDQAIRMLQAALRDTPRQPALLALSRQLELEQRLSSDGGRRALAETRSISLDFRNAPLASLLEAITRGSGINFVLDRDVKLDSRATIYMKAGKVEDAIDMVLSAHQLSRKIMDPQTVLIYPNTPDKTKEHQEQVIRVFYLAHAEAKATAALLRSMLRVKEPFVDDRANMIVLRESPEIITLAERLVALHDVGEAEVMLEVEIIEIKTSRLTELGISFPNSFSLTPLTAAGATGYTVSGLRGLNSSQVGVSVAGLLVNLRREVGDFNTLANPRIRTKSREKAKILIGDKVPVITSSASASGFLSENVSYLDVGLKLDVEPIVSPDDEVQIKLALEVSSIAKEIRTAGGSVAYQIGTRNANTSLRLRDGETQLLGGLISNEDRSSSNRIPGLGDLPLAGRLFSSQKDDYQRTELVLAITPRIIRPAARADIAQAELWIGSESATRLRQAPSAILGSNDDTIAAAGRSASIAPKVSSADSTAARSGATTPPQANPIASPTPALGTRMQWRGPAEVKQGDRFAVSINVNTGTPIRSLPIEIAYPSNMLEVVAIAEGGFLKQGDSSTSFVQANNPGAGRISIGVVRNDSQGTTGEGSVAEIQFRAKAAGNIQLSFTSVRPAGDAGMVTPDPLPMLTIVAK
jgi:general secretion pathway protein D